jgi:site-specific DNA-methyltransferase (adenine-specific)
MKKRCTILHSHVLDALEKLPTHLVQCIVTSIPYYKKRRYDVIVEWPDGWVGELGWEPTLDDYVWHVTLIFREAYRVLRNDGVLYVNIGDTYNHKTKELYGVPWSVAFGLKHDSWKLRSENIWEITDAMPDSCEDRPGRCHETVFLFTKRKRYYYDRDAVRIRTGRESTPEEYRAGLGTNDGADADRYTKGYRKKSKALTHPLGRNLRDVWHIPKANSGRGHYSDFPEELVRRCLLAGSRKGDIVLDPFCGTGTTGIVALANGRRFIGIDAKRESVDLSMRNLLGT